MSQTWFVDTSGVLIEDGLVHKLWWADEDGKMHYAEARAEYLDGIPLVAGPWVEYSPT